MKIYTRSGDGGDTALFGGGRVSKADARVRAYGTVDEANAVLGLARAALARGAGADTEEPDTESDTELDALLAGLQSALFDLGADLATPLEAKARQAVRAVAPEDVAALEARIDAFDAELEPLTSFVLPGGEEAAAALHLARTVVRRAERDTVVLAAAADVNPEALRYLNRLSDLLFTLARVVNARAGRPDVPWRPREARS